MEIYFASPASEDIQYWRQHDKKIAERIEILIADILEHPFSGIGKPEPLRFQWSGYWSRRINKTHRLASCIQNPRRCSLYCSMSLPLLTMPTPPVGKSEDLAVLEGLIVERH